MAGACHAQPSERQDDIDAQGSQANRTPTHISYVAANPLHSKFKNAAGEKFLRHGHKFRSKIEIRIWSRKLPPKR